MQTFLVERVRPAALRVDDLDNIALPCRWDTEAYRDVGAVWLGGVVTSKRMVSLVVAGSDADLQRYRTKIGVGPDEAWLSRVVRMLGPYFAAPRP